LHLFNEPREALHLLPSFVLFLGWYIRGQSVNNRIDPILPTILLKREAGSTNKISRRKRQSATTCIYNEEVRDDQ
jgi:hypothetical protein